VQCAETMVSPLKFKEAKADGGPEGKLLKIVQFCNHNLNP
jgi:hypothetical protein